MPLLIDAYSHVGLPRFCSPAQALDVCDHWGIARAVMSLGPGTPDIAPLARAVREHPDRVRAVGIPFGATEEQRHEIVLRQLDAGFMGIRLDMGEATGNPRILKEMGSRGAWIYLCAIPTERESAELLLQWLTAHEGGRIASPHFIQRALPEMNSPETQSFRTLLEHPRFYPILSRQGDGRSAQRYPFGDLLPWVALLVEHCGWDRILWGSEHPVLLWRNETLEQCKSWLADAGADAGVGAAPADLGAHLGGNAERAMFAERPEIKREFEEPDWLEEQFDRSRILTLFQNTTLDVPMDRFEPLMAEYLRVSAGGTGMTFGEFAGKRLLGGSR